MAKINNSTYSRRYAKDFNILTKLYQLYALYILFVPFSFLFYKIDFKGNRGALKKNPCIVAANHISYLDPFIATWAVKRTLAYMAKKELFVNSNYLCRNISRLGAFPVNREKLEVSTIKSAREVFKAKFSLCIFPQGGIRTNKKIESINKGFVAFAKMSKVDILPVAISGLESYNWDIFNKQKVSVEVGDPISYLGEEDNIIQNWREQIATMCNYELV